VFPQVTVERRDANLLLWAFFVGAGESATFPWRDEPQANIMFLVRADKPSGDLEAISVADDATSRVISRVQAGRRGRRSRWVVVNIAVAFFIGLSAGALLGHTGGRGHGLVTNTSTDPASSTTVLPPSRKGLQVLFTHVAPTGGVVIAREGLVSTADAYGCPGTTPVQLGAGATACHEPLAQGVQFDFSAPGNSWYRLTVLNFAEENDHDGHLHPVAIEGAVRVVRADGTTRPSSGDLRLHIAAFHSRAPIATVRVPLNDGGNDEMSPADGWTAFAAEGQSPFAFVVEGLDADGRLVARTQSRRLH
jgi:hypothetical protein